MIAQRSGEYREQTLPSAGVTSHEIVLRALLGGFLGFTLQVRYSDFCVFFVFLSRTLCATECTMSTFKFFGTDSDW